MKSKSFEQGCKIEIEIKSCLRRQKPSNKTRMFSFHETNSNRIENQKDKNKANLENSNFLNLSQRSGVLTASG